MVKFRFQKVLCYIAPVTLLFSACSNNNESSDNIHSEYSDNMIDFEQNNLFIIEPDSSNQIWETSEESNSKQRTANINPAFISVDSSGVDQEIIFNIYEEESFLGEIRRVSTDLNGVKSISGALHEDKGGFVFTVDEGRLLGQLRLTDRDQLIQIRFSEELNEYILTELNRRDLDVLPGSAPMRRGNN